MQCSKLSFASLFVVTLLAAGCASTPNTATALESKAVEPITVATADCRQLEAEIGQATANKRAALRKEQEAWKAIVPFVVAARYVSGKSAAESADQQIAKLQAEFVKQGCTRHGL